MNSTTSRLTKEELELIRKRTEAATPGPWNCAPGDSWCAFPSVITQSRHFILEDHEGHDPGECPRKCEAGDPGMDEDADFIAHARTDIPRLLDEIDRLRAALKDVALAINWDEQHWSQYLIGEDAAQAVLAALGFDWEQGICNESVKKLLAQAGSEDT